MPRCRIERKPVSYTCSSQLTTPGVQDDEFVDHDHSLTQCDTNTTNHDQPRIAVSIHSLCIVDTVLALAESLSVLDKVAANARTRIELRRDLRCTEASLRSASMLR